MIIKTAKFVKGIIGTDPILEEKKPQIAFAGRSNVGKSSVINCLVGRKSLVKSSSVPGKTRQINFFLINNEVYFVDLPGYGYAKATPKRREKLRKLILWYLLESGADNLKIVLIIDSRVGATDFDMKMIEILNQTDFEVIAVANKIDKLKKNDIPKQLKLIEEKIGRSAIPFSAKSKKGKNELLEKII